MTPETKPIKLLLVDDEREFRQAASNALTRQGFDVSLAESGEQALELIGREAPDVVVLDLRMGGMDGIATLTGIRKIQPRLPVIILTGHGQYKDALAGIRLEVVDFLQKPADLKLLGERILSMLTRNERSLLRECTIAELMTDPSLFGRIYDDQPLRDLVQALNESVCASGQADPTGQPRRAVLVYDRTERFVGLVRISDVVRIMVPESLKESPWSSYFTGMFLAQIKVVGTRPIEAFISQRATIDADAPLMEAVHMMVSGHLYDLPVTSRDGLVGVLRGQEIFRVIASSMSGLPASGGR